MALYHSPSVVTSGLVLYLDAANPKSYPGAGTTWFDLSGNGNNGTLTNGPTFDSSNSGSILFDAVDDHSMLPTNFFSYPTLTTFSITLWFKSNQNNGGTLFGQQSSANPSSANGWVPVVYLTSSGQIRIEPFWTGSIANNIGSQLGLNDFLWHNVTTTFNLGTNQLYIDGNYVAQRTGLSLVNYTSTYYYIIGAGFAANRGLGSNYFNGYISNFSFYDKALSPQEIKQNFNAVRGRYGI